MCFQAAFSLEEEWEGPNWEGRVQLGGVQKKEVGKEVIKQKYGSFSILGGGAATASKIRATEQDLHDGGWDPLPPGGPYSDTISRLIEYSGLRILHFTKVNI